MANQAISTQISSGSATEIDFSDEMAEPFNTRQNVDPIDSARIENMGQSAVAASAFDLTSVGQVSDATASSLSGGSGIGVTGPYRIVLGTAMQGSEMLVVNYVGPSERTAETDVTNP
jgi:hypothetical protein